MQQEGDEVIGAEQCAGHRGLECVCIPVASGVELWMKRREPSPR
jgi:hypothetical protein